MHTLLLRPTDVLFFRDGRPMNGSLSGHGAAWPAPSVFHTALHAALWRAGFAKKSYGSHGHGEDHQRKFGSVTTAGPFPVCTENWEKDEVTPTTPDWFFPRPLDSHPDFPACDKSKAEKPVALFPSRSSDDSMSSLPNPLKYAVASAIPASKSLGSGPWWNTAAYQAYLSGSPVGKEGKSAGDSEMADAEHSVGIGIDPETQTTGQGEAGGKIYTAHHLRLRECWQLGCLAEGMDTEFSEENGDLISALFCREGENIVVGGNQRVCTVALPKKQVPLPLPLGLVRGFSEIDGKHLVKWILLTPALWPQIEANDAQGIKGHSGGWLPNWIDCESGEVLLKGGDTERQENEGRVAWRRRVRDMNPINARLVAAATGKAQIITGWALRNEGIAGRTEEGAKSTHLAVPAGAVYYFECDNEMAAVELATALNWHGDGKADAIRNRRSTLLGEKGFGLGVCSTWHYHDVQNIPN